MRPPTPESNTPIGRPSIAGSYGAPDALRTWATLAAVSGFSRGALLVVLATVAALLASAPAGAFTRQDVTITSADGTPLAATLTLPDAAPPAGRLARRRLHARPRRQTRATGSRSAQGMGIGERYAVLAYDARGHGDSGGLIGIDGPKEIADVKAVFAWLRDRPDVADTPDRRLGRLVRRRRRVELARRRRAVGRARDLHQLDRPPRRARRRRASPRPASSRASSGRSTPSASTPRCSRSATPPSPGTSRPVGPVRRRALVAPGAQGREDTGVHDAGAPRLRLRAGARAERLPGARRPEAALARPQRPRAVVRASPPTRPRCSPRAPAGSTASCAATPRRRSPSPSRSPRRTGRGSRGGSPALPKVVAVRSTFGVDSVGRAGDRAGRQVPHPAAAAGAPARGLRLAGRVT